MTIQPSDRQQTEGAAPPVDVVVATHHRPELLRVALDSILEQTYSGLVTVVVVFDRAEPDLSLARSEGNRRVEVITNTRAPGLAGARNSGIAKGTGQLVAFCDDDDSWLPDKLARQVEALGSGPALTSVTGITIVYGGTTSDRVPLQSEMTLDNLVRSRVMAAHPSTVLVRREALLGPIGLVDEEIPGSYGEDFDWMIRAMQAGPVVVVEAPLVRVMWGQSLFSSKWQTIVDAIDYGLAKHQVFHEDRRALARLHGRRSFALAAMGRRREALTGAARTLWLSPIKRRGLLAAAVAMRMVSADRLMDLAHRRGHGI